MDLTEHTDASIARPNCRAAAGVIRGIIGAGLKANILCPKILHNGLDEPLDGEEIDLRAVGSEGEILLLNGKSVLAAEVVGPSELVEPYLLVAEVVVSGEYLKHGRQRGRAHDGGVLAQRVEYLKACALGGVCRHADLVVIGGGDERVGDYLVIARSTAQCAEALLKKLLVRVAAEGALTGDQGTGNVVVAVEACDLLGKIGVVADVASP